MTAVTVSVIVASRGRPDALELCLTALGQQQYYPYEVIVVADPAGLSVVAAHPLAPRIKTVAFDRANLAQARNLGLVQAAGEVVAFIDDDAVAEPSWLDHLVAPFEDFGLDAAGGYVIGRNGISLQWGARTVDYEGWHRPLEIAETAAQSPGQPSNAAVRLEGTNMAIRREVLIAMKGFDEVFRYYMDDTDLSVRLAKQDCQVAVVPQARVFHHQAPSNYRTRERMPRTLRQIGASTAAYLNRHADPAQRSAALAAQRADQKRRLLRHMVAGHCVPEDISHLMSGFDAGAAEDQDLDHGPSRTVESSEAKFRPLQSGRPQSKPRTIAGWVWRSRTLRNKASAAVMEGNLTELYRFTPTALYHQRHYVAPGVWLQTGGLFGRSVRNEPLFRLVRFRQRVAQETVQGPFSRLIPKDDRS